MPNEVDSEKVEMNYDILQKTVWAGCIPLEITLSPDDCRTYDESLPYFTRFPRVSYLPQLLPRLRGFFAPALIDSDISPHLGWFSFQGVPLKWQYPVGLLYDLLSGAEPTSIDDAVADSEGVTGIESSSNTAASRPWKLVVHFSGWPVEQLIPLDVEGKVQHDAFINVVKEADFLRNGTAKVIMSLSKHDSTKLWESVQKHDLNLFNSVNYKFLNPLSGTSLRHVPLKVYLPVKPPSQTESQTATEEFQTGSLKVVQTLIQPSISAKEEQTLGSALRGMLPTVFPSRRAYIHAQAVMHGVVLPLDAPVQELMRSAAFADGFCHIAVLMST